jgi:hypothetical protein
MQKYFITRSIFYFIYILAISLNVGCELEVSRKKNAEPITKNEPPQQQIEDNSKTESLPPQKVEPLPSPTLVAEKIARIAKYTLNGLEYQHYQAEVSWTKGLTNVSVYLDGKSVFSQQDINTNSCILDLHSDTNYSIQVYTVNDDTHTTQATKEKSLLGQWEIRTPLDILLDQKTLDIFLAKTGDKKIIAHRVFLEKNGQLLTQGQDLIIDTNELFVDRSEISTFNSNQKATNDVDGRPGGNIFLKAKKAHGVLAINMRGEDGGDGTDGTPYTERAGQGPKGENGVCISVDTPRRSIWQCEKKPKPGGKGLPGADGRPGTNGGNGGSTGLCKVEIAEQSQDFLVNVFKTEGNPGVPGKASLPQLGGIGGPSGDTEGEGTCCHPPNPRNDGEGNPGNPGTDGNLQNRGLIQTECVAIGAGHCF